MHDYLAVHAASTQWQLQHAPASQAEGNRLSLFGHAGRVCMYVCDYVCRTTGHARANLVRVRFWIRVCKNKGPLDMATG